jgi:hypothetical protein
MDSVELLTPESMLNELNGSRLEVVLIPAPDPRHSGHMIRAAESVNPFWYRKFCQKFMSGRKWQNKKGRTRIKRRETIVALETIIRGQDAQRRAGLPILPRWKSIYIQRLLEFIKCENERIQYQRQMRDQSIPAAADDQFAWIKF